MQSRDEDRDVNIEFIASFALQTNAYTRMIFDSHHELFG